MSPYRKALKRMVSQTQLYGKANHASNPQEIAGTLTVTPHVKRQIRRRGRY